MANLKPFYSNLDSRRTIPAMLINNEYCLALQIMTIPSFTARNAVDLRLVMALANNRDRIPSARAPDIFWLFLVA